MSDNKRYYYLKLKESYFDQDHIKVIEAMDNGYIYSLILLKLYLKSLKGEGCLMIANGIPYDPKNINMLARVLNHDPDHVQKALSLAQSFEMIQVIDQKEIWVKDIQTFIGHSSTEGDRKREYRKKLSNKCEKEPVRSMGHLSDKRPPELELELELETEKETKEASKDAGSLVDNLWSYLKLNDMLPISKKEKDKLFHQELSLAKSLLSKYPDKTTDDIDEVMTWASKDKVTPALGGWDGWHDKIRSYAQFNKILHSYRKSLENASQGHSRFK